MTFKFSCKKTYFMAAVAIFASIYVISDNVSPEYMLMIQVANLHTELYKLIVENSNLENFVMSSFSLHSVLSLLTFGARGETEGILLSGLGFPSSAALNESYTITNKNLDNVRGVTLKRANRIYVAKDLPLNGTFLKTVEKSFSADAKQIDFADNTGAAQKINKWVEYRTIGKITNLISPNTLSSLTALVLVNALYFKGFWDKPFDPRKTVSSKFTTLKGNEVDVEMMQQTNKFLYGSFSDGKYQALEMKYKSKDISMLIILPVDADAFKEMEDFSAVNFIINSDPFESAQNVYVQIPKFTIETPLELNDYLPKLGFAPLFSGVDLSGLIPKKGALKVTHVVQKTFIEVNEFGTEAAAATAVIVTRGLPKFVCNRPFLFYIFKRPSGKILFAGRKVTK